MPRIANSYIRMGYAALGSAIAGAGALWLMGSYNPDGFAWSDRSTALVTVVVVGPVMLAVYFVLLRLFRVSELRDMLRPLLGRFGRGANRSVPERRGHAVVPLLRTGPAGSAGTVPRRATTSVDTGLIPRISGEFDAVSFRAGPDPERGVRHQDMHDDGSHQAPTADYLPGEEQPGTARGGLLSEQIPLPGPSNVPGEGRREPVLQDPTPAEKVMPVRFGARLLHGRHGLIG